jgi:hypothetical protein
MADCLMKNERQNDKGSNELDIQIPGLTLGNVGPTVPEEIEQMVSDVPTGSKSTSKVVMKQITASDVPVKINRNGAILTHWLNLPFTDGLMTVASIYKVMASMADNYQRTHQDAFFEAWPGMLITSEDESPDLIYNTTWLRINYKKLCKRAAHYIWHYMNASYLYTGSLANLLIISRANGVSKIKDLAYQTRWSKINTETNLFDRFLSVKGRQSWICENSKYALGRTNYGSDLLSIPLWITDIYGNRGTFSLPVDNMFTTKGGNGYNSTTISVDDGVNQSQDTEIAHKLLLNMYHTIAEYSRDHKVITVNNKKRVWSPMMPPNYNGVTVNVSSVDELSKYTLVDQCNILNVDDLYVTQTGEEHFTGCLWNNYKYWEQYMLDEFSPFMNENSDFYEFVTTQLGLFERSMTPQDMLNLIRSNQNCDMAKELLPRMNYKGKSNVNTATLVKFTPMLKNQTIPADNDQSPITRTDATVFQLNYERFDVDSTDVVAMIAKSKEWPCLTPTIFGGAMNEQKSKNTQPGVPYLPIVINSTPTTGIEGTHPLSEGQNPDTDSMVPSVTGKFSSYFDIAATRSLDPENTQLQFHSVTADLAKQIVDRDNGITFEEDPTTVRTFMQPMIDNTDPYQCGFNLLIDSEDIVGSELSRFYTDPVNFGLSNEENQFYVSEETTFPSVKADFIPGREGQYLVRHSSIKYYRDRLDKALLFLGSNVFNHPIASCAIEGAAMPLHLAIIYEDDEMDLKDINTREFATRFKENDLNEDSTESDIRYSILYQLFSNGAKVEYKSSDKVTTDSHFDLMTEGDKDIATFMFSPWYGPIKPVTFNNPDMAGTTPIHIFEFIPPVIRNNAESRVVIYDVGFRSLTDVGNLLEKQWSPLYSVFKDAARRWFYPVRSLTIRPVASDNSGNHNVKLMGDGPSNRVVFTAQSDYLASFMNQTIVQFTGMQDTMPFWSNEYVKRVKSMSDAEPIIGKAYLMPEQNLMAEPRAPREVKQTGRKNAVGRKFTKYTSTPTPTSTAAEILSDSGRKSVKPRGSKPVRGKHSRDTDFGDGSNSGVKAESEFAQSNYNAGSLGYSFDKDKQSDVLKKTKHDDQQIMQSE